MKIEKTIALLPGDGIGPEVIKEAMKVLNSIAVKADIKLQYHECLVGGASIEVHGEAYYRAHS